MLQVTYPTNKWEASPSKKSAIAVIIYPLKRNTNQLYSPLLLL